MSKYKLNPIEWPIVQRCFCKHEFRLMDKHYGDAINLFGCRERWKCWKCGAIQGRKKL